MLPNGKLSNADAAKRKSAFVSSALTRRTGP